MNKFYTTAAYSLLFGALLAVTTMALHPVGGSMEQIMKQAFLMRFSHSIALCCLPVFCFGCYGLSRFLNTESRLPMLAFYILLFGLVAGMFAGLLNGLVMPGFLLDHADALAANRETIDLIIHYSLATNSALGYVLIVAVITAVSLWSFAGMKTKRFGVLISYAGWGLSGLGTAGLLAGFKFISVVGLTAFVFGAMAWFIAAGLIMLRARKA